MYHTVATLYTINRVKYVISAIWFRARKNGLRADQATPAGSLYDLKWVWAITPRAAIALLRCQSLPQFRNG